MCLEVNTAAIYSKRNRNQEAGVANSTSVKAAVLYEGNTHYEVKQLEQDPPSVGEVRVKMGASGVCLSDHHFLHGNATIDKPIVLGHEGAGTVVEVGQGVTRVKPGDRCILSFVSHCGMCRTCLNGFPNVCETNVAIGPRMYDGTVRLHDNDEEIFQMSKLGVFSDFIICPQQACQPIPDDVSIEVAALIGCSVTTGVGGVINNPNSKMGMTVAVFGCGGVGLNVIQGAKLMNASRIIAVDIVDHKLEFTYKFGATDTINSAEVEDVSSAIKELTGGGVDMAFDSIGNSQVTADAVKSIRPTGTAVMIGLSPVGDTTPIDMVDMLRGQKTLMGSYYGSTSPHESFRKIVDFYRKGDVDVEGLIQRIHPLDEINEAFSALDRREDGRGIIKFPG